MVKTEKENRQDPMLSDWDVLSIPHTMLEMAGIPNDTDLIVEAIPGVLLIGCEEPFRTANRPLLDLFAALGIEPEEVESALLKGGYFDE